MESVILSIHDLKLLSTFVVHKRGCIFFHLRNVVVKYYDLDLFSHMKLNPTAFCLLSSLSIFFSLYRIFSLTIQHLSMSAINSDNISTEITYQTLSFQSEILTKYEFKLRYKGTVLGVGWSLLAPFLLAIVLYVVFRNVFKFVENFALYVLVGVFVFRFFSLATSMGCYSIIGKSHLVTKTNLHREILPLVTTLTHFLSSFVEFLILIPIIIVLGGKIG